jgi:hypothetical protein
MSSTARKWLAALLTALCYTILHEGAHALVALILGTYEGIVLMFPGVQVLTNTAAMTDFEIAVFCMAGPAATLALGYTLAFLTDRLVKLESAVLRAVFYIMTLGMLFADPFYLSVLSGFVGGGDMNGIVLLGIPRLIARLSFGALGLANGVLFIKHIYPAYVRSFS